MSSVRHLACCLAIGLLASGCGGQSDAEAVEDTVREYFTLLIEGDGEGACAKLTGEAKRLGAEQNDAASCDVAVSSAFASTGDDRRAEIRSRLEDAELDVEVRGDQATATFEDELGTIELVRVEGTWYIDSVT